MTHQTVERVRACQRLIAALVAVALPVTVFVQSGAVQRGGPSSEGRQWSTVMGDAANRHSQLDRIDTNTVARPGVAAVTFTRPGTCVYTYKEHPWADAQITSNERHALRCGATTAVLVRLRTT